MSLPLRRFRARRCARFINIKGSYYPVRHNKLLFFEKLILLYSVLRTAVYPGDAFFKAENFISAERIEALPRGITSHISSDAA